MDDGRMVGGAKEKKGPGEWGAERLHESSGSRSRAACATASSLAQSRPGCDGRCERGWLL
eukprot:scaffold31240_cov37-Tisochrysis_lutea.AAC.3